MQKKLYKDPNRKMISGVLAGFSDYLGIDVTLLRIAYVLLSITTDAFPGLILYIVLAILMPEKRTEEPRYSTYEKESSKKESQSYQDVSYKENPEPEEVYGQYKKSGGAYTPEDRDR
ncbi:MAG TPA: hypothetical protein DEA52_06685 [Clostridiaceae bacterium]|nr:hypothetical protein [Clostridiaceae bacterium]